MNYQTLAVEQQGEHILLVRLNRPQVLNALNTQMGKDQHDLWTRLTAEPGALRCVVLTGAGDRAFCAGADLKERDGMTETVWRETGCVSLARSAAGLVSAARGLLADASGRASLELRAAATYASTFDLRHTIDALQAPAHG